MIGWTIANVASSLIVAMIVAFKLGGYSDSFNWGERWGMMAIATGMLLRIAPIVSKGLALGASPFDDWSTTLLQLGLALYFGARLWRVHRHWYRNHLAKKQAEAHFGGVGRH